MKKYKFIGMAARMVPDKLHSLLIEIVFENKFFFMKNKIKILFAGDGFEIQKLKKLVKEKRLDDIIFFNGRLNEKMLVLWFRKLFLYIHLSKDETTSTSILQAMAMSLPIIASNISGNKNLNKSNNIILVDNDANIVFKKIKFLLKNSYKRKKLSNDARKIAVKYFSCEKMYINYERLFKN